MDTQAETKLADAMTDSFTTQDSILTEILGEIKKGNELANTTNAGIEKLAKGSGSKWVQAANEDSIIPGKTADIYGSGFMTGATGAYKVLVQDTDSNGKVKGGSKVISQPIVAVGPFVITYMATHSAASSDGKYNTNVVVKEMGEVMEGPTPTLNWDTAAPTLELVNPPASGSFDFDSEDKVTFGAMFRVSDGDHELKDVTTTVTTSSATIAAASALKIQGSGNVRTLVCNKFLKSGDVTFTIKATDKHGKSSTLKIQVTAKVTDGITQDGWTLIMKIKGSNGSSGRGASTHEKYGYDWAGWENKNEDGAASDNDLSPTNRKFKTFMTKKFQTIRVCADKATLCTEHKWESPWTSAQDMFYQCDRGRNYVSSGRKCRTGSTNKQQFINIFKLSGHRNCNPQLPGFSQRGNDNARARWGFMSNLPQQGCQTSDGSDSDAAIGIGLMAQGNQCRCGAGATPWFRTTNTGDTGCATCRNAWVWVKE
jgi:hypothetical protein